MATSVQKERRRRITEHGADRMALITGQIKALPSPSTTSIPSVRNSNPRQPDQTSCLVEDPCPTTILDEIGCKKSPVAENDRNPKSHDLIDHRPWNSPTSESPNVRDANAAQSLNNETSPYCDFYISSREINSSILASEGVRLFLSLTTSLIVVYFHSSRDALNMKATRGWKPLWTLLLTNVAIVVGFLFNEKRKARGNHSGQQHYREKSSFLDATRLLERGLVVYQAVRAILIDCSVYFVITVSGLSLLHGFNK